MIRQTGKKIKLNTLFYTLSILGILLFFGYAFIKKDNTSFSWLVMENNSHLQFSDYFRHIGHASHRASLYSLEPDSIFPAFGYVMYYILWRINPFEGEFHVWSDWTVAAETPYNLLIFLMYCIVNTLLFFRAIQLYFTDTHDAHPMLFSLTALFPLPFLSAAIERGNSVWLVLSLMILALAYKDSSSKIEREAALILIAVCAGLKIYPAVFGLLYLKEKRWKEAMRLLLYGLLLFFVPFAFFGGLFGIKVFFENLLTHTSNLNMRWTSVTGFLSDLLYSKYGWDGMLKAQRIGPKLSFILLLLLFIFAFFSVERWRARLFLSMITVIIFADSHRYTAVYLLLPLLEFLRQYGNRNLSETDPNVIFTTILFSQIFSIPALFLIIPSLSSIYIEKVLFTEIFLLLMFTTGTELAALRRKKSPER